jgi:hypothetical protein
MAIIPPHRPGMPAKRAFELIESHLTADPGVNAAAVLQIGVVGLAIRGYFRETFGPTLGNDVGYFDDALIVADVLNRTVQTFNWNTDPSRLGYNAAIDKGFAILKPGVWMFHKGQHKQKGPAWRQADDADGAHDLGFHRFFSDHRADGSFGVWRGSVGKKPETGHFNIALHWGDGSTSSWGCNTGPGTAGGGGQWGEIRRLTYLLSESGLLPYVLIDNDQERVV